MSDPTPRDEARETAIALRARIDASILRWDTGDEEPPSLLQSEREGLSRWLVAELLPLLAADPRADTEPEPIAWLWQHDDSARTLITKSKGSPGLRYKLVSPLYVAAARAPRREPTP